MRSLLAQQKESLDLQLGKVRQSVEDANLARRKIKNSSLFSKEDYEAYQALHSQMIQDYATLASLRQGKKETSRAIAADLAKPSLAPFNTNLTLTTDTTVTLYWSKATSITSAPITSYILRVSPGDLSVTLDPLARSYTVQNLTPGTSYTFELAAVNAYGEGPKSTTQSLPGKPQPPTIQTVTPNFDQVFISWQPPDDSLGILAYRIISTPPHGETLTVDAPALEATISSLTPGVSYTFQVASVNAYAESDLSPPSDEVLATQMPEAPSNVVASITFNEATVTWQLPVDSSGITAYLVTSIPSSTTVLVAAPLTTALVTGLLAGVSYTFQVAPVTPLGQGLPSSPSNAVRASQNPVTVSGEGPVLSETQYLSEPTSLHLPGTGHVILENCPVAFGSFFLDLWVYPTLLPSTVGSRMTFVSSRVGPLTFRLGAFRQTTTSVIPFMEVGSGASWVGQGGHASLPLNTWTYVAIQLSGNPQMWVGQIGTNAVPLTLFNVSVNSSFYASLQRLVLGGYWNGSSVTDVFQGYIDNVRMSNARGANSLGLGGQYSTSSVDYTTNNWRILYVNLFSGQNGSSSIPGSDTITTLDVSGVTLTPSSSEVVLSSTQFKSAPTSLYIPGRRNHVIMSNIPQACYGPEWTIEFWVYFASDLPLQSSATILRTENDQLFRFELVRGTTNNHTIRLVLNHQGVSKIAANSTNIARMTWHHVQINRRFSGTTPYYMIGINNTLSAEAIMSGSTLDINPSMTTLVWGARTLNPSDAAYNGFDGYIDDVRITDRVIYSHTGVLPSSPFPFFMFTKYLNDFYGSDNQTL